MIQNIENKTIYVYCLASVVTGGCELLHQLVDYLNNNGREAYIVYVGKGKHEIPQAYSSYNIKVSDDIVDTTDSIIVVDEGFMYLVKSIKYAHCIFWWLSVDNFFLDPDQLPYHCLSNIYKWNKRSIIQVIKTIVLKKMYYRCLITPKFKIKDLIDRNAINAYQSEYAHLFLKRFGFTNIVPLKDYINTEFITNETNINKEKIVIYNPKKGWKYTKKLIDYGNDIEWIPLTNLSRKQMQEVMLRAMVYVDFGNHPGKDRIPREAALNRCCIITGKKGSANNAIDIEIPSFYKIDEYKVPISKVLDTIKYVLNDYEQCVIEQKKYVDNILSEKTEFEAQIRTIFNI